MPNSDYHWRPSRRDLLSSSLGAACAASASLLPAGGLFSGGSEQLRIGLIGCGGRGTGAARQAAIAHPGVRLVAVGDLFEDHLAESVDLLQNDLGAQFHCSPEQRFVGRDAWHHVLNANIDAVILAATPWSRPVHFATAVSRGLHVYAERPAAADIKGLHAVLAACNEATARGLIITSGLAGRHHEPTRETIARIRHGAIGQPRRGLCRAQLGMPWHRLPHESWTPAECRMRNWVTDQSLSGGPLLERHLDAIDRSLQAFGNACPVSAAPVRSGSGLSVCYRFADGAELVAEIVRSSQGLTDSEERVWGTEGTADLRGCRIDGLQSWVHEGVSDNPWQACMSGFIHAIFEGGSGDGGVPLCRSTLVALLGRTALETGHEVAWSEVAGPTASLTGII